MLFKSKTAPEPGSDVEERLKALEEAVGALAHIEIEWEDMFEKFKNLYARLNKRVQRDAEKEEPPPEPPMNPAAARILGTSV